MRRLFQFIYYYRAFFTFLFFEILCILIIVSSNRYQSSSFFNTTNLFSSSMFSIRNRISNYFRLGSQNEDLARENAFLREIIAESVRKKSFQMPPVRSIDSSASRPYDYLAARVIDNSVLRINNYLTIDKGSGDGVEPGMGVISSWGIVGKVKASSGNYATVYSLLHSDMLVSSVILRNHVICTTTWNGENPYFAELLYVPRHIVILKGDTVTTSGYNSIFPEGIPIGIVDSFWINENETFYHIKVKLSTDFRTLSYVYVIRNRFRNERDSLEQATYN